MSTVLLIIIYLSFVAIGILNSMLGAVWPVMHLSFGLDVSNAGYISFCLALGIVLIGLLTKTLNDRIGYGRSTLLALVLMTVSQIGIAFSKNTIPLCLFFFLAGGGSGIIEITMNNYVSFYYKPKHMSWMHALWGVGALSGPLIVSYAIVKGNWRLSYLLPAMVQIIFILVVIFTLPFWQKHAAKKDVITLDVSDKNTANKTFDISFIHVLPAIAAFFFYKAMQSTTSYWGSSFLVDQQGISPENAAKWIALFFAGTMISRFVAGFLAMRFSYKHIIYVSQAVTVFGILLLILPLGKLAIMLSFLVMGLGIGSFFPGMIRDTPYFFGKDKAEHINSVEISFANLAGVILPPVLGWLSKRLSMGIFPFLILMYTVLWLTFYIILNRQAKARHAE